MPSANQADISELDAPIRRLAQQRVVHDVYVYAPFDQFLIGYREVADHAGSRRLRRAAHPRRSRGSTWCFRRPCLTASPPARYPRTAPGCASSHSPTRRKVSRASLRRWATGSPTKQAIAAR